MRQLLVMLLLFYMLPCNLNAQFYIKGQEPASTNWLERKTPEGIKLIFPHIADSIAIQYGNYLDQAYRHTWNSSFVSKRFQPVPVVIHPNSMLSNGFVSWAPKRMEVVSTPFSDSDPEPWLKTLAFHETQHVYQVERLNHGFFKGLYYLFGEQAPGAAVGFVPLWFLEGESICNETAQTYGGRGRDAFFYQPYRTHLITNKGSKFSYDKWLLSSYKDYIPNHYQFGYQLVGYTNMKFGEKTWTYTLRYVASYPFSVFPFYFGLKRETGLSRKKLYEEAFSYTDSIWHAKHNIEDNHIISLNVKDKRYVEYLFPFVTGDSTFIAYKKDISKTPLFIHVNLSTGKEKTLYRPGTILGNVSHNNQYIIWSQYRAHPRWEYVNWSEIWILDIGTHKAKRLTQKTRYSNPVFTNNGEIITIEHTPTGQSKLVHLDITGNVIQSSTLAPGIEPKEIAVSDNGLITVRASTENGTIFLEYSNLQSLPKVIFGPVFQHISNIKYLNDKIFFIMSNNYKNDVFALDEEGNIYQVTNSMYGINNISYYNDSMIVVSHSTSKGILPGYQKISYASSFSVSKYAEGLFEGIKDESTERNENSFDSIDAPIKKHHALTNLFNFHSWAPLYYNPSDLINGGTEVYPGLTLLSQNLTSTAVTSMGYSYKNTHGFHGNFQWMGWYPIVSAGVDIGNDFPKHFGGPDDQKLLTSTTRIESSFRVNLPILLTSGEFYTRLTPNIKYSFVNDRVWDPENSEYIDFYDAAYLNISFYSIKRLAHRDIRSRLGFYLLASRLTHPSVQNLLGPSLLFRSGLYLPGVSQNHSLLITSQHERHLLKRYFNSNRSIPLRGLPFFRYDWFSSLNADYTLPILYPDLKIGSLVYVKRIFLNIFSDNAVLDEYTKNTDGNFEKHRKRFGSNGIEVFSDMHFFRTRYEFRLGYRVGLVSGQKDPFSSFLVSVNMESIYGFLPNSQFYRFDF